MLENNIFLVVSLGAAGKYVPRLSESYEMRVRRPDHDTRPLISVSFMM